MPCTKGRLSMICHRPAGQYGGKGEGVKKETALRVKTFFGVRITVGVAGGDWGLVGSEGHFPGHSSLLTLLVSKWNFQVLMVIWHA